MASVQERLQLKRVPLDKWSISEQLYLASAVICSGDQNWMSVSRSLKMMCGGDRPSDWFSQKSCAAQYGLLLENVETPKRKKRNEKDPSQASVETASELILRKLTQERVSELRKTIQDERNEYLKIKEEVHAIENDNFDENQLKEIWQKIENQEKQREKEQQKNAQWLKEREERKKELERAWRPNAHLYQQGSSIQSPTKTHPHLKTKVEEMEVDDPNSRQGTSPLLTSLLKSPSPAPNPTSSVLHTVSTSQARVTAPTITNLLTGSVTNLSTSLTQPSTSVTTSPAPVVSNFNTTIHSQPCTGPVSNEQNNANILQSPSQSAPTLSMLLENKNKENIQKPLMTRMEQHAAQIATVSNSEHKTEQDVPPIDSSYKDEEQQLMEVFNGLISEDELGDINSIILNPELLEEESILDNVGELIDDVVPVDSNTGHENVSANIPDVEQTDSTKTENITDESDQKSNDLASPSHNSKSTPPTIDDDDDEDNDDDDDSSDLSNDTPLSELVKLETLKAEQQKAAAAAASGAIVNKSELNDLDSDSNDEKSLESLKRELQAEQLKDTSSDALNDSLDKESPPSEIKTDEIEANDVKLEDEVKAEIQEAKTESIGFDDNNFFPKNEEEGEKEEGKDVKDTIVKLEKIEEDNFVEEIKDKMTENAETVVDDTEKKDHTEKEEKDEVKEIENSVDNEEPEKPPEISEELSEIRENDNIIEEIEDDDVHMAVEEAGEGKNDESKDEPDILKTEEKDSVESVEIVEIKDDDDKVDPSVIIIEENDDTISEDNQALVSDKNDNTNDDDDDIVVETKIESPEPRTSERKISSDDELFEDAKDRIDDIKADDIEQNTEQEIVSQTITIIDTDDDSPFEVKTGRTKRDYSRRKQESTHSIDKRSEETTSSDDVIGSISSRLRAKDRERSESPYVEEDSGEPATKTKRRYSSTPNIDSLPNSPASSDDREYRGWKKSIMLVYNRLITHKCASLFAKPISEDHAPNYKSIILQPMDLQTLKRNIDSGSIRTTMEFRRYVMIMCYNAIFYNCNDELTCSRAKEMLSEALLVIDDIMDTWKKENDKSASASTSSSSSTTKIIRGRKSNRLMN